MQELRILEMDQFSRVVLGGKKKVKGARKLKKLWGWGFGGTLRTMGEWKTDPGPQVFREQEGKPGQSMDEE